MAPLHRWVDHTFRDRGGIKCHERYSRPFAFGGPREDVVTSLLSASASGAGSSSSDGLRSSENSGSPTHLLFVPSALFLRRYLRLLEELLDMTQSSGNGRGFALVICESAAELADYRNCSPIAEAAAPNERSRVIRLVEENAGTVVPFADLSVVLDGDEEMDVQRALEEATVEERARIALCRAGQIVGDAVTASAAASGDTTKQMDVKLLVCEDDNAIQSSSVSMQSGSEMIECLHRRNILSHDQRDSLLDLATRCEEEYNKRNVAKDSVASGTTGGGGRVPYVSQRQVDDGLKAGIYYRGKLEVTKANNREAYVTVSTLSGSKEKYYIDDQLGNFNRALHGDDVIIEPLGESLWGSPVGRRRLVHVVQNSSDDAEEDGATRDGSLGPKVPSAKVVALHTPVGGNIRRRQYVATVQSEAHRRADDSAVLFVPMDTRIPKIRIKSRVDIERIVGKRLLVEVDGWDVGAGFPSGHISKIIGPVGDLETEIACLLIEHNIFLPPFSKSALACLPDVRTGSDWLIPSDEIGKRLDLRKSHRIFSVDPPGCQDIDDTMSARILPSGDVEVGVHIADVTYFVPHNSSLDLEARSRGTTFYLVDRRFDMLPSILSSDLCSLHGQVDRLAVSVIWTLSPDLEEIKSVWYGRTVIHNCAAMTYDQADSILQDVPPDDPTAPSPPALTAGAPVDVHLIPDLKHDLSILTKLARKLRKKREDIGGAVDLSSGDRGSELKFELDRNGNPVRVAAKTEKEIHHTIAEMMIFANGSVASRIHESFPDTALLRIHRHVEEGRFEELESTLKVAGIDFDGRSNRGLANTLKSAKLGGKYGAIVDSLLQSLATRAMSEAQYVCSGAYEGESGFSHYGLGIDKYTHFTSPIRRYADVVVHRELLAAISADSSSRSIKQLEGPKIERPQLETLPESNVMTVLGRAKEDENLDGDDLLDSLIEGASELALESKTSPLPSTPTSSTNDLSGEGTSNVVALFDKSQVVKICDRINHMNRIAKLSSMDCQRLFLSLYFRENIETTSAVILSLRANGVIVYIPKFDLKGPVFLSDRDGHLQIDPAIVGLPPTTGLPPTSGFSALEHCRLLPEGTCDLLDDDNLVLGIRGGTKSATFRPLDVITVQLSSGVSETTARVPPPRIHLVSEGQKAISLTKESISAHRNEEKVLMTTKLLQKPDIKVQHSTDDAIMRGAEERIDRSSIFHVLSSIKIESNLAKHHLRCASSAASMSKNLSARKSRFPGRIVVGDFSNPDTLMAEQAAAAKTASEAAAQRRTLHTQAAEGSYDAAKKIEREATARMQRLAAGKRNARRRKAG